MSKSKTMSKTKRALDRYDLEIEDIKKEVAKGTDVGKVIHACWVDGDQKGGLFSYCSPDRDSDGHGGCVGCLTQIKNCTMFSAADPQLTRSIRGSSLPDNWQKVELRHLSQFARWQRKMDAMWPGRGQMQMPEGFEQRLREMNSGSGQKKGERG